MSVGMSRKDGIAGKWLAIWAIVDEICHLLYRDGRVRMFDRAEGFDDTDMVCGLAMNSADDFVMFISHCLRNGRNHYFSLTPKVLHDELPRLAGKT